MKSLRKTSVPPLSEAGARFLAACWQGGTFEGFEFFCRHCLLVRSPDKTVWKYVPLELNDEQILLAKAFLMERAAGRKVRYIILKARKLGISTLIQAFGMWFGSFTSGWKTKTVGQLEEPTKEIAQIGVNMAARLPEAVRPYIQPTFRNGKLIWLSSGSEVTVETQRSDDKSRGGTPSLLHMSEVAFWDAGRKGGSAESTMAALFGSLEEEDGGGSTAVFIETTANGIGGTFHTRWMKAHKKGSEWRPFFFPWQTASKHQLQDKTIADERLTSALRSLELTRDEKIAAVLAAGMGDHVTAEWAERAADFTLSTAQLRWAIAKADELGGMKVFDQEYPMSAELAFISSGRMVLDTPTMRKVVDSIRDPALKTGLLAVQPVPMHADADLKWSDVDEASGQGDTWHWWALPVPGWRGRYSVGVDPSMGSGQDHGCIWVKDLMLNEQVAEFYCSETVPDILAIQAMIVGRMYGDAVLCIEINGPGNVVVNDCLKAQYPNIYRRAVIESELGGEASWVRQFGVYMDESSRIKIVDGLVRGLRDGTSVVRSERMLDEFSTFRFDAKGKADHQKGAHSDAIMAGGLAEFGRRQAGEMEQVDASSAAAAVVVARRTIGMMRESSAHRRPRTDPYFGNRA
jgi:hypothetical protein